MSKLTRFLSLLLKIVIIHGLSVSCASDDTPFSQLDTEYIEFVPKGKTTYQSAKEIHITDDNPNLLLYDHILYLQDMSLTVTFQPISDNPLKMSIGKSYGYFNLYSDRIEIYSYAESDLQPQINETLNLPHDLKQGVNYKAGFTKTLSGVEFFLIGNDISIKRYYKADEDFIQYVMPGKTFVAVNSGDVIINGAVISSTTDENPLIHIIGDSFIEGGALPQFGYNLSERWCIKLAKKIGEEKCMIDGHGGDKVGAEWFERLKTECRLLKSKYVFICMGTNNYYTLDQYSEYMTKAISFLHNNNQTPILATVTPRTGMNYHSTAGIINEWVKNSGELYVDFHAALTEPDDPGLWRREYILPDGIHPSPKGYDAMYECLVSSMPVLFESSSTTESQD